MVPVLFGISVTALQQWMATRVDAALVYNRLITEITQNTSSLYHLAAEFVRYPRESRARKQWLLKHEELAGLMSHADTGQQGTIELLDRLQQSHASLLELQQRFFIAEKATLHSSDLTEQQQRIADQIFMLTQNMISDALALGSFSADQVTAIRDLQDRLIILFTLVLILLLSFFGIIMGRQIIRPLDKLKEGTEVIGDGALDYRVGHISNDELGDLGFAFDRMAGRLQATLASRDQLNTEVEERRRNEEALQASRKRLMHAEHIAQLGSWDWDIESDKIICSEEMFIAFGIPPQTQDVTFDQMLSFVHPEEQEAVEEWMREAANRTGGTGRHQFHMVRPDGTVRVMQVEGDVSVDPSTGTTHMMGTLHDITERWEMEDALRESEAKYRNLLVNIPQKVFYKDRNSIYMAVNPSYAAGFGRKPEEFVGKDDFVFHDPEFAERYRRDDQKIMQGGCVVEMDQGYILDGTQHTVHIVKVPVRGESGKVIGILGVFWDISERKQMESELNETRQYLHNVVDSMPSVLIGLDTDGRVTHWNPEAAVLSAIPSSQAIGQPMEQLLPQFAAQMAAIKQAITQNSPLKLLRVLRQVGNEKRYLDLVLYPLTGEGRQGAVLRIDDVTERVRMESTMVQTEKMMSVGGLAAGMAHELNNPLGGVLQGLQNVQRRFSPELDKNLELARELGLDLERMQKYMEGRQIRHFLDGISEAAGRAGDIVNNMLQFSRKAEMVMQSEEIVPLIERTLELASVDYDLKKKYDFRNIVIERDYDPDAPPVSCIASEIQQVLLNLLRNAAQAISLQEDRTDQARIVLRTALREEMVLIEVEDNGPGMDESTCRRVFEPFFTTRPPGQGTGLGLSVSYFIVNDEHNGRLSVRSIPGKGTIFSILLPTGD
ncbi:MAG: PAS domain-containing protein [Candidatus Sedimenticola sp. (ex Thyasira tokunagai)]